MDDDHELKTDIPNFEGNLSPDDFIDWLYSIERVFEYKGYLDEKKCKVVILKFKDYVSLWWDNVTEQKSREGKEKITTWKKLKKLLKKLFLLENHRYYT